MTPEIEITGLSKVFGQGAAAFRALTDIDLTVGTGEFFTLLGPSGCGKTTLLRMIAGFEAPTTGSLRINGDEVAGIIVEPLQRIIPPAPGFLQSVRALCDRYGIVLIFDEVVTGFRFAYGGAQEVYGVTPDLCTLGKIIGGGFPLAAVAGRKTIMDHFDKAIVGADRWLMMLGTLSGNPVAAVAGLKTMEILRRDGAFDTLRANGARLMAMFDRHLSAAGIAHRVVGHPTLFDVVFTDRDVRTYRDVQAADAAKNAKFNAALRENGVFKSPGKVYPSLALTEADFALTDAAIEKATAAIA